MWKQQQLYSILTHNVSDWLIFKIPSMEVRCSPVSSTLLWTTALLVTPHTWVANHILISVFLQALLWRMHTRSSCVCVQSVVAVVLLPWWSSECTWRESESVPEGLAQHFGHTFTVPRWYVGLLTLIIPWFSLNATMRLTFAVLSKMVRQLLDGFSMKCKCMLPWGLIVVSGDPLTFQLTPLNYYSINYNFSNP